MSARAPALAGTLLLLAWLLCLLGAGRVRAQERPVTVEVFTDAEHPVTRVEAVPAGRLTVYRIDGLVRAQDLLSEGLPSDEESASRMAAERFMARRADLQPTMLEAAEGLARALFVHGLDRYPAVVFSDASTHTAVIYGITDLSVATRIYRDRLGGLAQ